jgi:beta-lactamase class D
MRKLGITTLLTISFIGSNYPLFQPSHNALASPDLSADTPTRKSLQQQVNFERHFKELGIEGSILIYDLNRDQFYQHNPERNSIAFAPASTFKIFNSLVALETGVIPDEEVILPWDGIKRDLNEWNQDLNLRQAIKYSAVWFYQVLARRIGHERMQDFINRVGYGNRQIGTKEAIDTFWLNGNLKITPTEQIEFLRNLYRGDLPFSKRTIDIVKDIMIVEQTPNYILRGKTGWSTHETPNVGWFVGYLEQNENVYFFATNIDIPNRNDAAALLAARLEITRRSLLELGLLEDKKL